MTHSNPYESFYHGLVVSKLWLCEELEKIIDTHKVSNPSIAVLGGWHNLMSFMMVIRRPVFYKEFNSYDKDIEAVNVANKICDTWKYEYPKINNHCENVSLIDFSSNTNTVFINCSVDQFENTDWYRTIPAGSIVCLQTTDIVGDDLPWEINQQTKDIPELVSKYPMTNVLFSGSKGIQYGDNLLYNRLMVIGFK